MMLTLHDNIAAQVGIVFYEKFFGRNAAVGHDQHSWLAGNGELNNERLVVSLVTLEPAWWEKNPGPDVSREIKFVPRGAKPARVPAPRELGDQPAVNRRPIRRGRID